jgi:NADH-quinone oxidoreductase subunit G
VSDNGRVRITLNGHELEADQGRLLIDVAEEAGVYVPRFCYHPGMRSVAVCRMCLVKVEGMPKLAPACATPVSDGMVVDTLDEQAVAAQEQMLEFLLINHPLDCPICDRGGECPLQDQTYKHGPGHSRFVEPKRTFEKALEISDLVVLDRERCVLCWRCVRFSDEIAGDRFIQLVDRGAGTQILTFNDEPFDSYFSGNTIQICPVGALTAKTYRFVSRPWDLESAPSVCSYCSVGCPVSNEARAGKLVRVQALPNEHVNDFWMCDKGRFGFHHVSSDERLTTPLLRTGEHFTPASWTQALAAAAERLQGKDKVALLAGGHLTTEDAYAIARLARDAIGTPHLDSRIADAGAPYEEALALGAAGSSATIDDLERAATIVWAGPDPKEALPVLYLKLRAAVLEHGARLIVVSPRRGSLDPLAARAVRTEAGGEAEALVGLGELEGPAVICWGPSSPGRDERALARAAVELAATTGGKLLVCPPHAGSQGMIDMGVHPLLGPGYQPAPRPGMDTRAILEAAAADELDALVIFGADPVTDFPDRGLAERALSGRAYVVVVELFATETARRADVVLPAAAHAERAGTFTNLERRLQRIEPVLAPPGSALEPWRIAAQLASSLGQPLGFTTIDELWADLKARVFTHAAIDLDALTQQAPAPAPYLESGFEPQRLQAAVALAGPGGQYPKGHRAGAAFHTGQNWPLSWELRAFEARLRPGVVAGTVEPTEPPRSEGEQKRAEERGLALYSGRLIYDDSTMLARSAILRGLARPPFVALSPEDAGALGIAHGDEVELNGAGHSIRLRAVIDDVGRGCVWVPYAQPGFHANRLMSGPDPVVEVSKP